MREMTTPSVLAELAAATKFEIDRAKPDWVGLVRAVTKLPDPAWDVLSTAAKSWTNDGVSAIQTAKAGPNKNAEPAVKPLQFPPLEPSEEPLDPTPAKGLESTSGNRRAHGKKNGKASGSGGAAGLRAAGGEAVGGGAKPRAGRKSRAKSFKKGGCYHFVRWLLTTPGASDGRRMADCVDAYNAAAGEGPKLKPKSGGVIYYDMIAVLRVLRDEGLYEHPIVVELGDGDSEATA